MKKRKKEGRKEGKERKKERKNQACLNTENEALMETNEKNCNFEVMKQQVVWKSLNVVRKFKM